MTSLLQQNWLRIKQTSVISQTVFFDLFFQFQGKK